MGWGSTADYMQGTSMRFRTREAAIHFAEKQGWSYQVDKVQEARIPPKSYGQCRRTFDYSASSLCPLQRGPHAGAEIGLFLIIGVHRALTSSPLCFPLIPRHLLSRLSNSLAHLDTIFSGDDRNTTAENYVHSQYPFPSVPWLLISIGKLTADLPLVVMVFDSPWKAPTIPDQVDVVCLGHLTLAFRGRDRLSLVEREELEKGRELNSSIARQSMSERVPEK